MFYRVIQGFNRKFTPSQVRVSLEDGTALGILPLKEAFRIADEKGLDLVGINPNSNPPVCKIIDYGRFKYQQKQREKEAKKNQVIVDTKEMKLRPKIDQHDLDIKIKQMVGFLQDGDKVRVSLVFKGREIVHPEIGEKILNSVITGLKEVGLPEGKPVMEGKQISILIGPIKKVSNVNSGKSGPTVERRNEIPQPNKGSTGTNSV